MIKPAPLPIGSILQERFRISEVLGQGGFGIAYRAEDLARKDEVVIKELAPVGVRRDEHGVVHLEELGFSCAHHLRRRFIEEAKSLSHLNLPCIPRIRAICSDFGTVSFATEYFAGARTLESWVKTFGPMDEGAVMKLMQALADVLEMVHQKGMLHRDIKPSNILVRPKHPPILIDFGSAREWHADKSDSQTLIFTPNYAPVEMFSELGFRGPATDVYGLAATGYFALLGTPPPTVGDRMNGIQLPKLSDVRPNIRQSLSYAIESGLHLRYEDRPASMADFSEVLHGAYHLPGSLTLEDFDKKAAQLKKLKPQKKQCPCCGEILTDPKPLPKSMCPVCRRGVIKKRNLHPMACPLCRTGVLRILNNQSDAIICPICTSHALKKKSHGLVHKSHELYCKGCKSVLSSAGDVWTLADDPQDSDRIGETHTWDEWRELSRRTAEVVLCDTCEGLFDVLEDGRWHRVYPPADSNDLTSLHPEEWARVAANLDPGAGTHFCNTCEADFYIDENSFTLLGAYEDPFGFAERFQGRHLTPEQSRWVGSGKVSPHPGPTCTACGTEFDAVGPLWRLVRTSAVELRVHTDEVNSPEDWHRLAAGLPMGGEEIGFYDRLDSAILNEYLTGKIGFDEKGTLWKGPASLVQEKEESSVFVANEEEITFGPLLRKLRIPYDAIREVTMKENHVLISSDDEGFLFVIEPIELSVELASGTRSIILTAKDLCTRMNLKLESLRVGAVSSGV